MRGGGGDRREAPVDEPGTVRLFFAVPVPADARERVGELMDHVQQGVGDGRARIRWVRVEGLHLTLRFLGPTPASLLEPLRTGADDLARSDAPFEVRLSGGGAFPSLARPRSLWIGVREGAERLAGLAEGLTAVAARCGLFLDTRPFAAHLTIARTDGVRLAPAAARALEVAADGLDVRFTVDRVVLFRSILGGGPARYEALHEAPLRA
jgi:RNA 2',3'-cyclic 3'-phosphodiesterase